MDTIILDSQAVGYIAHYTTAALKRSDGTPTGVVFGFLLQVRRIVEAVGLAHLMFAWDSPISKRKKLFPEYKSARAKKREEDPTLPDTFFQFDELHNDILPRLGFANNWKVEGYEADDIIAHVCQNKDVEDRVTIVSNDQDLYQLLGHGVRMWKPSTGVFYTAKDFRKEFSGLCPCQWATVKALAGCPGDGVPGIRGVGNKTVVKYLMETKGHKKIDTHEGHQIWSRNLPLVQLPFEGLSVPEATWPNMDYQAFKEFCLEYEFAAFIRSDQFWRDLFQYKAPTGFYHTTPQRRFHGPRNRRD